MTSNTLHSSAGSLLLRGGRVWDGKEQGFVARDLLIRDGVVVDPSDAGPAPQGVKELDAGGAWILPGLIDAHFHAYAVSMDGLENERGPLSYSAINGARRLEAALRRGFTTVRDVAGGDVGLRNAVDRGLFASPRYLYTGPALSQTGGHGDPRSETVDICFCSGHMCDVVDGVDDLRRAVRDRFRRGAHAIKIMTSGGVFSLTDPLRIPQYSAEEIRAVADEAARDPSLHLLEVQANERNRQDLHHQRHRTSLDTDRHWPFPYSSASKVLHGLISKVP